MPRLGFVLLAALVTSTLAAQQPDSGGAFAPYTRIRLTTVGARRLSGYYVGMRADSIAIQVDDGMTTALARRDVTRIEVVRGSKKHVGLGLVIGVATGVAVGALIDRNRDGSCHGFDIACGPNVGKWLSGLAGLLLGGAAGGSGTDVWVPLDDATVLRLMADPTTRAGIIR